MTTPWPADSYYLQLGDLVVDLRFRRLIGPEQDVEVPQRVFDLFLLLLSEPGKLHSRSSLFARLWSGTIVEDTNLSQNVWLLRKALGETRKGWIRTVAKSGYVFDPPGPLQWFQQLPVATMAPAVARAANVGESVPVAAPLLESLDAQAAAAALAQPAANEPAARDIAAPAAAPAPAANRRRRRRLWSGAAAALALACIAAALLIVRPWASGAGSAGRSVAVVAMRGSHSSSAWPATLLEQWLSWKLDSLPDVNLVTESDLAAGGGPASVDVIFLSSERLPDDAGRIVVYARLLRDGKEERFQAKGPVAEAPVLVDSLSRQLVARLLPEHKQPWPALELSAAAAERYAQAAEANRQRDWMGVAKIGGDVVAMAPRFGLMRLQLAGAQASLYNAAAANEQMQQALRWLAPVPPGVAAQLQAQRLAVDPFSEKNALEAYSALIERYPDKAAYRLAQIRLLLAVGRPKDALTRLAAMPTAGEPASVRFAREQLGADAHRMMGDLGRARAMAVEAEKIARDLGPGWTIERADAMLTLAICDTYQHPERGSSPWYEQAAQLYDQAGNSTRALQARFLGQSTALPGQGSEAAMGELLARARAGGYRRLEIMALMASGTRAGNRGDIATRRAKMQQAYAVSEALGDVHSMRQLSVIELNDLIQSGRFADADTSIGRLRGADLQTGAVYMYGQSVAKLAVIRGRYPDALAALDEADRLQPDPSGQADAGVKATLGCARADALTALGRIAEARRRLDACAKADYRFARSTALLGQSRIELLAGDRERAAALLDQARKPPVTGSSSKWTHQIGVAELALRLGDTASAERLYAQTWSELQPTGYTLLMAAVRVGQAESAAIRGDWAHSRTYRSEARTLAPGDAWSLLSRVNLIDAWDARERGDTAAAATIASELHRQSRRLGDVAMELQVHRLLPAGAMQDDCSVAEREAALARTGMRGAGSPWLEPRPAVGPAGASGRARP
ncbi:winged helix-turn-helix domain-containing protein [Lysobacter enzymogenes]|uniref:winged helix-turn-helix domain-containing protein n=1 Tax=Lysobacter enzymogenes TaxID=69 RepID=UPI00384A4C44